MPKFLKLDSDTTDTYGQGTSLTFGSRGIAHGGYGLKRARALCPDGKLRNVLNIGNGVIEATVRVGDKSVRGTIVIETIKDTDAHGKLAHVIKFYPNADHKHAHLILPRPSLIQSDV